MIRIAIDPNVRVHGDLTFSGFAEVDGDITTLAEGHEVIVYEPESGATGTGHIDEIDSTRQLIYIDVAWKTLVWPDQPVLSTHG